MLYKYKYIFIISVLIFWSHYVNATTQRNNTFPTFTSLYKEGVNAYLDERWQDCIDHLEGAVHTYKLVLTAIADCRIKCLNEPYDLFTKKDIEDLRFFEKIIKRTLCFIKCKRIRYPNVVFDFSDDAFDIEAMEDLSAYSYLHICYFKKNLIQKAASAVFTYLVKNPDEKIMKTNLEYYLTLPEVDATDVTNYETPEYLPLYLHGINAYNNQNWEQVEVYMEEALLAYIAGEQRCRALCEGSFDQGWLPDFMSSVANHFTYCLKCKRKCPDTLKTFSGTKGKEILADMYNYLQFAYNKLNKLPQAYRCVASYLLIYPTDADMIQNKKIYSSQADPDQFVPRPEIVNYLLRLDDEEKLLQFINQSFVAEFQLDNGLKDSKDSTIADDIETNNISK